MLLNLFSTLFRTLITLDMKKIIRITTVPASMKILLKGQLKFMSQYYEMVAISSDGEGFDDMVKEQEVRGIKVNMSRKITPWNDLKVLFQLIKIFRKEKPYIVHTHTPKAGTLGMWAAWICRVPYRLHTVAGMPLLEATGAKRKILDIVEKMTYSAATKVYPNSHNLKKIIEDGKYCKPSKLKVIGEGSSNGIDTSFFSKEATLESLNREGKSPHTFKWNNNEKNEASSNSTNKNFVFCFVGRVVKDKGINELVAAFIKLNNIYDNAKLLIVGSFEENLDSVLSQTKEALYSHPSIDFVGFQADVRPFLMASDALAFPSYREGFPNVVMQAGAMGLPSIVSNINGCNEIIVDGINGKIIPPKDENVLFEAMKYFVENENEVKDMASRSREMITTRYERGKIWNALLKEYQSL